MILYTRDGQEDDPEDVKKNLKSQNMILVNNANALKNVLQPPVHKKMDAHSIDDITYEAIIENLSK